MAKRFGMKDLHRRDFLKALAVATGGLAMRPSLAPPLDGGTKVLVQRRGNCVGEIRSYFSFFTSSTSRSVGTALYSESFGRSNRTMRRSSRGSSPAAGPYME